jgi:hypothetical protein
MTLSGRNIERASLAPETDYWMFIGSEWAEHREISRASKPRIEAHFSPFSGLRVEFAGLSTIRLP